MGRCGPKIEITAARRLRPNFLLSNSWGISSHSLLVLFGLEVMSG